MTSCNKGFLTSINRLPTWSFAISLKGIFLPCCLTCLPSIPCVSVPVFASSVTGVLISNKLWLAIYRLTSSEWLHRLLKKCWSMLGPCTPSIKHFFFAWWISRPFKSLIRCQLQGKNPMQCQRLLSACETSSTPAPSESRGSLPLCHFIALTGVTKMLSQPWILMPWVASPWRPRWGLFPPVSCLPKLSHGFSLVVSCSIHRGH